MILLLCYCSSLTHREMAFILELCNPLNSVVELHRVFTSKVIGS